MADGMNRILDKFLELSDMGFTVTSLSTRAFNLAPTDFVLEVRRGEVKMIRIIAHVAKMVDPATAVIRELDHMAISVDKEEACHD